MKLNESFTQERICKLLIEAIRLGFDKQTCTDITFGAVVNCNIKELLPDAAVEFNNRFVASVFNLKDSSNYQWVMQIYDKAYDTFFTPDEDSDPNDKGCEHSAMMEQNC